MTKVIRVNYDRKAHEVSQAKQLINAVRYHGKTVTRHHDNPILNWLLSLIKG